MRVRQGWCRRFHRLKTSFLSNFAELFFALVPDLKGTNLLSIKQTNKKKKQEKQLVNEGRAALLLRHRGRGNTLGYDGLLRQGCNWKDGGLVVLPRQLAANKKLAALVCREGACVLMARS